ncbi:MAG: hypothetical protein ABL998_09765 [Planctomycetota bacterium]
MNHDRLLHLQVVIAQLNDSVVTLHHRQDVWSSYAKRMRALPEGYDLGGEALFHEWMAQNYADSMAVGIRRVVFPGSGGGTSMIGLLRKLQHGEFGMPDAMAVYGTDDKWRSERHREWLRSRFFKNAEACICRSAVGRDIARLESDDTLTRIKTWADKRVAHSVPHASVKTVAFDDVGLALEVAGNVLHDYSVLLTGSGIARYTPVIADPWEDVLDRIVAGRRHQR